MRISPYDNYYNRSRTRQSLRPQNDEVVQSGAIPTRRDMDGRVTDAIDPTQPKTGGMTHRDMRGNIIQPRVPEWKTPVNQPVQTISAPGSAQNLAGRQALFADMKKVGRGNITPEMENRAKSLGVNPTRFRNVADQLNPAPANAPTPATATNPTPAPTPTAQAPPAAPAPNPTAKRPAPAPRPAVPATEGRINGMPASQAIARAKDSAEASVAKQIADGQAQLNPEKAAKQAAIAKQNQETAGMVALAKSIRDADRGVRSWREKNPTAPASPTQPGAPNKPGGIVAAAMPKQAPGSTLAPMPAKQPGQMSWKQPSQGKPASQPAKPIDFTGPKAPSNPQPVGAVPPAPSPQPASGRSPGQSGYRRGQITTPQQPTIAQQQARDHSARLAAETAKSNADFKASAGRAWSAVKNTLIGAGETAARSKQDEIRKNEAAAARAKANQMRATQGRGY